MKAMTPDRLRELLAECRKEVANYYTLYRMATNGQQRVGAKFGHKSSTIQGEAYLMELKRRKCFIPALEEYPMLDEPEQIELFEKETK